MPVNIFIDDLSIGPGFKSVTFSIIFQHSSKTLEDKDVNPIISEIIRIAEKDKSFSELRQKAGIEGLDKSSGSAGLAKSMSEKKFRTWKDDFEPIAQHYSQR